MDTRQLSFYRHRRSPLSIGIVIALLCALLMLSAWPASAAAPVQMADPVTVRVVVGVAGATLLTSAGESAAHLAPGARVTATARSADGEWLQTVDEQGARNWVAANEVVGFGLSKLPVVDGAPTSGNAASPADESASSVSSAQTEQILIVATNATTPIITAASTGVTLSMPVNQANADVTATVITGEKRLNIRSGPGESYPIVAKASAGEQLSVIGRSADAAWLAVRRADLPDGAGWVAARFVTLDDDVDAEPILPAPEPPAAQTTATSVSATAQAAETHQSVAATGLLGNLVFQDGRGNIYVYDLASGALRWLTGGYSPDVSADGTKVVFTRTGEEAGLWAISIDGSGEYKVYSGSDLITSPKWSPDGEWIVFSRLSGVSKCYQMGPSCVTMHELQAQFPQLSPDLIYDRILRNAERVESPLWGLARVAASGAEYRDIGSLNSAQAPDWSNAGIVYQSSVGLEITADAPGATSQSVFHHAWNWDPDWARSGAAIVYQERAGSHWEIWRVNPDGNGRAALTQPASVLVDEMASNVAPAWSPDASQIVFVSNRADGKEPGDWRLWVMDADGGNQHPLEIDVSLDYAFAGEQVVSWGP